MQTVAKKNEIYHLRLLGDIKKAEGERMNGKWGQTYT